MPSFDPNQLTLTPALHVVGTDWVVDDTEVRDRLTEEAAEIMRRAASQIAALHGWTDEERARWIARSRRPTRRPDSQSLRALAY